MAKTVAVLLYGAVCLGVIGLLVYWEVWWRTPEAQRVRLQRRIKKHCRRMEDGKAKLSQMPLPPSTAPNRIPDPIVRHVK